MVTKTSMFLAKSWSFIVLSTLFCFLLFIKQNEWVMDFFHISKPFPEIVIGSESAPITMIYYYSLSCNYCRKFHFNTLPKIKEKFIKTGKVKLIIREFADDRISFEGAILSHCGGVTNYFQLSEDLLNKQELFINKADPLPILKSIIKKHGFSDNQIEACLEDSSLANGIMIQRINAVEQHKITVTPSFIINGKLYKGILTFSELEKILNQKP